MSSPDKNKIGRKARRSKWCLLMGTVARHGFSADFTVKGLCALDFSIKMLFENIA